MSASASSDEISISSQRAMGHPRRFRCPTGGSPALRARLAGAGSGEGELRSSLMSQTASSPVRPLPAPPLLPLESAGTAGTAGAEAAAVAEVDADAETAWPSPGAGSASPAVPVRKGRSNASLRLATFFGPKPGRRASCAASACAIFAKLCDRHAHVLSEERGGRKGAVWTHAR